MGGCLTVPVDPSEPSPSVGFTAVTATATNPLHAPTISTTTWADTDTPRSPGGPGLLGGRHTTSVTSPTTGTTSTQALQKAETASDQVAEALTPLPPPAWPLSDAVQHGGNQVPRGELPSTAGARVPEQSVDAPPPLRYLNNPWRTSEESPGSVGAPESKCPVTAAGVGTTQDPQRAGGQGSLQPVRFCLPPGLEMAHTASPKGPSFRENKSDTASRPGTPFVAMSSGRFTIRSVGSRFSFMTVDQLHVAGQVAGQTAGHRTSSPAACVVRCAATPGRWSALLSAGDPARELALPRFPRIVTTGSQSGLTASALAPHQASRVEESVSVICRRWLSDVVEPDSGTLTSL